MRIFAGLFRRVTFTCRACGARQRIPLRRVHVFERFHELEAGEPVLIACPQCDDGLQIPSPYDTHTGHHVLVDSHHPPRNAFIHAHY
jgi:phage terminase large subunit GpA-like protein